MGSKSTRICIGTGVVLLLGLLMLHWPSADVQLYEHYGEALRQGNVTHGLPREYPALAGFLFVVPLYLGLPYQVAFGICCLACLATLLAAAYRYLWESELSLWFFLASLSLGASWVILRRYDVFPVLTVVLGVGAARSGRWRTAWAAVALGTLLKIFPALLLPGFFLIEWRRTGSPPWRRAITWAAVLLGVAACQEAMAPGTVLNPILYELRRGFEFSSLPGSLSLVVRAGHMSWHHGNGSWEVAGAPGGAILAALTLAAVLALAALWWVTWRGRLEAVEVSLAVLSVVVLLGKAFPPQYILWLAPLWAATAPDSSRGTKVLWILTCALTAATYPLAFALAGGSGELAVPSLLAAARNLALLAATATWLIGTLRRARPGADVPGVDVPGVDVPGVDATDTADVLVEGREELRPRTVVKAMLGR